METNSEVAPATASETITQGAIAQRSTSTFVAPWQQLDFTPERVQLMRKAITPPTATEAEFSFFLEWCKQTGLNPFLKQAYLIERWDAVNNAKKHEPMVAEAGFAARADALPDFGGMKSGVVYAGDEFMIDEISQEITHRWSAEARAKNGMRVIGAWAHAKRTGRVVEITYVTLESRIQKKKDGTATKFWFTDPAGQLRKCARADQYRRAYPNIFAGWYDPAEARDDEIELNAPPAAPSKAPDAKTQALKDRLGVKPLAKPKTVDAAAAAPEPKATPPKGETKSSAPPIDQLRFGPHKGKRIVEATTLELEEAVGIAQKQLANATGKEGWVASVKEGLQAIHDELTLRAEASDEGNAEDQEREPAAPEPGSDG